MRWKLILPVLALALAVLATAAYVHFKPSVPEQEATGSDSQVAVASDAPVQAKQHVRQIQPANGGQGVSIPDAPPAENPEEYVASRMAELTQMGMSDDPDDLKIILTELNNKDPNIRHAALSAAVQFGSADAVPALQNEVQWAQDPQEKVDIMNAINFLQLPSFSEFQASVAQQNAPAAASDANGSTPPSN